MNKNDLTKSILSIVAVIVVLGLIGEQDYQSEQLEQQTYCDHVEAGIWPDYRGIAGDVCKFKESGGLKREPENVAPYKGI